MQPLGIATAAAHLVEADIEIQTIDASLVVPPMVSPGAKVVAFSVPLFDSLKPTLESVRDLRTDGYEGLIVLYGNYAMLNKESLLGRYADAIILGDWETSLVEIARRASVGASISSIANVACSGATGATTYLRSGHLPPNRAGLPPLTAYRYAEVERRAGGAVVVGNVEASRGCRFSCSYCSVFAAHHNKVVIQPLEVVIADIDQLVEMGAEHICFVDAEFQNATKHAISIVAEMHARHPKLSFDFTSRADLLAQDPDRLEMFVKCGARFVTTALEFPKQEVLDAMNKGFEVEAIGRAVGACRKTGLGINPTFVLFNPWIELEDLAMFEEFLERHDLHGEVEPIQMKTRLWLYRGSPLLRVAGVANRVSRENEFNFEWRHRDGAVEGVYAKLSGSASADSSGRCCLKC
jgi:radical SAM superfamily enzyme YgiQ (UPF0313 family)